MINFVFCISTGILAFILFNLGMDHINFGHGINPWISLPLAIVCALISLVFYITIVMKHSPHKDED